MITTNQSFGLFKTIKFTVNDSIEAQMINNLFNF